MSQFAAPASLRRVSVSSIQRDSRLISEIPPPITVAPPQFAKHVEFASLSRVVQDRFFSALDGTFPPTPLLRSVSAAKANMPFVWVTIAALASALGVVLFRRGFGTLGDAMSIHSAGMAVVFAAIVATVVLASLRTIAMLAEARVLPYAAGIYLFPTTLVDARRATLEVLPLADLLAIEPHPNAIRLAFAGGQNFAFELGPDARIEELVASIEAARAKSKDLSSDADPSGYYALVDPLYEPPGEATSPTSEPRISLRVPGWARYALVLALSAGALVGPVLRWKRNEASDSRMFAEVRAADSIQAYRAYLAHGGAHHDEVEHVWLPRAELRDARATMLAELDRAREVGTLSALRAFAAAHPDHGLADELSRAIHGVHVAALDRYRPLAPDAEALAFVTRLLAFAEAHGPTVRVRIVRAPSPSLLAADRAVEGSPKFAGVVSYPSRYFDAAHDAASEGALLDALKARFASVFSAEILALEAASGANGSEVIGSEVGTPELTIEHHVAWTAGTVTGVAPPGVFVEPSFEFTARFVVPDGGAPSVLSRTVLGVLPETPELERKDGAPPPEETIYRAVSRDAFDRFGAILLARFLR